MFYSEIYQTTFKSLKSLQKFIVTECAPDLRSEYNQYVKLTLDYLPDDPRALRVGKDKYCHNHLEYKSFARNERYACSFDIAEDKGCKVERYYSIPKPTDVDFVRFPQGFDPDVSLSSYNLFDMWRKCANYRQVSAGISHLYRNILVVDIDNDSKTITIPQIKLSLRCNNLPDPNYIITHHKEDRDTYQLGFLMEQPIKVRDSETQVTYTKHGSNLVNHSKYYINLVHAINKVLDGDIHYSGWQIKNPFYCENHKEFSVQWSTYEPVSTWYDMRSSLGIELSTEVLTTARTKVSKSEPKPITASTGSRNYYLRMFIAKQVRLTNGSITEAEVLTKCIEHSLEFALSANKSEPQSITEITRVVHSSYNYFIRTYSANHKPSSKEPAKSTVKSVTTKSNVKSTVKSSTVYTDDSRKCSALKRQLSKFTKSLSVYNLIQSGYSRQAVSAQLGFDIKHFNRYNLSASELYSIATELLSGFNSTLHFFINTANYKSKNYDYWKQAINELQSLIDSYKDSSFNSIQLQNFINFTALKVA